MKANSNNKQEEKKNTVKYIQELSGNWSSNTVKSSVLDKTLKINKLEYKIRWDKIAWKIKKNNKKQQQQNF